MKTKHYFLLLLIFVCSISFVKAEEIASGTCGSQGDNLTWVLSDDGTLTISGSGDMEDFEFDKYYPWYNNRGKINQIIISEGVTSIESDAFRDCFNLTSLVIPNSVTKIGGCAFSKCSNLITVTIPNSVISIEYGAFSECRKLKSVNIPKNITSIESSTFSDCSSLTSIEIPNNVTVISSGAFRGCAINSINIPNAVSIIESWSFAECGNLTSVTIPNNVDSIGESAFRNVNNVVYSGGATGTPWGAKCVNGVVDGHLVYTDNTKSTLVACSNNANGEITIPNSVKTIKCGAFSGCNKLTSIIVPNSVTSIEYDAFYGVNYVVYSGSATGTPWGAKSVNGAVDGYFIYADNAKSILVGCSSNATGEITIPNGVKTIKKEAFMRCNNLTSVIIPNSVETIENRVFAGCSSLESVIIPDGMVADIGYQAFIGCYNLSHVKLGTGVSSIGASAFRDCKNLVSIDIPNSVTEIGNSAFSGCVNLTSIEIPNSVVTIDERAFSGCSSILSVKLSNSISSINHMVFNDCENLESITIPNSVTSIGPSAFSGCRNLSSVAMSNNVDSIGYSAFEDCINLKSIDFPNTLTTIEMQAFMGCMSLSEITLPKSLKSIGSHAFSGCVVLSKIIIPKSVVYIDDPQFLTCFSLESIIVEEGNPYYDSRNNCNAIIETASNKLIAGCKNTIIPNTVDTINDFAFFDCSGLTSITIPQSVTSIGYSAFSGCYGLTSIIVEKENTKYDSRNNCNAIIETVTNTLIQGCKNTIIPNSVDTINDWAFGGQVGLYSIVIPNSVKNIRNYAFYGCMNLKYIIIPNSVTNIGSQIVGGYIYTDSKGNVFLMYVGECKLINYAPTDILFLSPTPPEAVDEYFGDGGIYVPSESIELYKSNEKFARYNILPLEDFPYYNCTLSLNVNDSGMGYITIDNLSGEHITQGQTNYVIGTDIQLFAQPNDGYKFTSWSDGNINATRTITIDKDITLTALFEKEAIEPSERSGRFSVSATTKVSFAPGNLQFNATQGTHQCADGTTQKGTWRFAEYQWDYIGNDNSQISETYNGWIDLFGWGTSGWNSGANAYQPWSTSTSYSDYYPGGSEKNDLTGAYANADWGVYNQIGSDAPGTWRTLTKDEWLYLFHERNNAEKLFGLGSVNGVNGTIILPDDWVTPSGVSFSPSTDKGLAWSGSYYSGSDLFSHNTYTTEQWVTLEQAGAVFLPAAGYRNGSSVNDVGSYGVYWSGSQRSTDNAYCVLFSSSPLYPQDYYYRRSGFSVRLARESESNSQYYTLTLNTSDSQAGSVTGAGTYEAGENVTITATANDGYKFTSWSDGDINATRTITIDKDITLTANFETVAEPCETTYGSVEATAEGSYVWYGETYTQSGQYQHTIQNVAGCDSIITLNLTITKPDDPCRTTYGSVSATAEGSYVWFGETYTQSGQYQHTIQNVSGCDSVITLNLTITKPIVPCETTYSSISFTAEGSYVWYGAIYTQSGQYQHTIQNVAGCDSIITLNLTITKPDDPCRTTYGSVEATAEGSYVWYGETYTQSGQYQHTIQNVAGCDSVITLNLTIVCAPYKLDLRSNNAEQGVVTILQQPTCENNQTAIISATPVSANYRFNQWSDGNTDNPRTLILTSDMTLYALFSANSYTIIATSENTTAGSVIGSGTYPYGTQVQLQAVANTGYSFTQWSDGNTDNPRIIMVIEDLTLQAEFSSKLYSITAKVNDESLGYTIGSGQYAAYSFATLTAIPYDKSKFVRWSDGVTTDTRRVLVLEDATYTAIFEGAKQYHISVLVNDNNMGYAEGAGNYYDGETVTLTAIPYAGYRFDHWFDNNTDNPRNIVVTKDKTYKAYFTSLTGLENNELQGVSVSGNTIMIDGHDGRQMQIYTVTGQTIYSGEVLPTIRIDQNGVYLIRIGERIAKVAIER